MAGNKKPRKERGAINPLRLIAAKQRVGRESADEIALPVLAYLDAAKRGLANAGCENGLVKVVILSQVIGSNSNNKPFYEMAFKAGEKLMKAAMRQDELLRLTTGEYEDLRKMIARFLGILPLLEVGMLVQASAAADQLIAGMGDAAI